MGMTDQRIEAAATAIREAMIKHDSTPDADALAKAALAAADGVDPLRQMATIPEVRNDRPIEV